jgi:hypothetical protein
MAASQEKTIPGATAPPKPDSESTEIDRNALAGTENSLGAESVRDGRPATDDSTVEAKDELGPGVTPPPATGKGGK